MSDLCPHPESLSTWLDGELSEPDARRIERHLRVCDECRAEAASLTHLSDLFTVLRKDGPHRTVSPWRRTAFRFCRCAAAAALVTIAAGAVTHLVTERTRDPLGFERYLADAVDGDVAEISSMDEASLSRDRLVGLLISSAH